MEWNLYIKLHMNVKENYPVHYIFQFLFRLNINPLGPFFYFCTANLTLPEIYHFDSTYDKHVFPVSDK